MTDPTPPDGAPSAPAATQPPIRPAIVGTATEIGKTWFSTQLISQLRRAGHAVAARKPVQSYEGPADGDTDADLLAAASGEHVHDVCPAHRWYPEPMAPPMAADRLGRERIRASDLIDELRWPAAIDIGVVETVGGVRSPFSHDTDSAGFAHLADATHAILVADAGLGTINAVRLASAALGSTPTLIYLNRYDDSDLHRRNLDWLTSHDGFATAVDIASAARWLKQPST